MQGWSNRNYSTLPSKSWHILVAVVGEMAARIIPSEFGLFFLRCLPGGWQHSTTEHLFPVFPQSYCSHSHCKHFPLGIPRQSVIVQVKCRGVGTPLNIMAGVGGEVDKRGISRGGCHHDQCSCKNYKVESGGIKCSCGHPPAQHENLGSLLLKPSGISWISNGNSTLRARAIV